jgi:hypothetical protein
MNLRDRFGAPSFGRPMLLIVSAVLAILAAPGVGTAAAAPSGVHFDPDSPAGQEYALPLERAREEAGGVPEQGESKAEGAALFGAGVSSRGPRGGGPAGTEGAGSGQAGQGTPRGGSAQGGSGDARPDSAPASTDIGIAEAGGGFSLMAGVGVIAAILAAAAIVGLVLRRLPGAAH